MDQLICASLSDAHYWYEVGMLKVQAIHTYTTTTYCSCTGSCLVEVLMFFLNLFWTPLNVYTYLDLIRISSTAIDALRVYGRQ